MAEKEAPFGFDGPSIDGFDAQLAQQRIRVDLRSDFIYCPQYAAVFEYAFDELFEGLCTILRSGEYTPGQPISIDVPKASRVNIEGSKSLGPNYTRTGSILAPQDRLLYQLIADHIQPLAEKVLDRTRIFSHRPNTENPGAMYLRQRECWLGMQARLAELAAQDSFKGVLRSDVSDYFPSVNQHSLVRQLRHLEVHGGYRNALESMLLHFTLDRSSRGIIQGLFPSDLLGTIYLQPIDQFFAGAEIPSVRYVDDIYTFYGSLSECRKVFPQYIEKLRTYDLSLNEKKTEIVSTRELIAIEQEVDLLFKAASEEIRRQTRPSEASESSETSGDYGLQTEWLHPSDQRQEITEPELEIAATVELFSSIAEYPDADEKIQAFCLPILRRAGNDAALELVLERVGSHPHMAKLYASYLAQFLDLVDVRSAVERVAHDEQDGKYDSQLMWLFASLLYADSAGDELLRFAEQCVERHARHEALRSIMAIYISKFGNVARQDNLAVVCGRCHSPLVQTAILYGTRYLASDRRRALRKQWGRISRLHELVAMSLKKVDTAG